MTIPPSEPLAHASSELTPARRRRMQRSHVPRSVTDPKTREFLEELAHKVKTSPTFLLFSFLSGVVLMIAICLDHPALYILAALLAPYMAPVIALGASTVIGSFKLFLRSLFFLLIGVGIIFGLGSFTGWLSHFFTGLDLQQASLHAVLSWPDLLLLVVAIIVTNILVVRSSTRPLITSVALVYELYIPAGVAGFGLTSGLEHLWKGGMLVVGVHLGITLLLSIVVLALLGLRLRGAFGYILVVLLVVLALLLGIAYSGILSVFTPAYQQLPVQVSEATLTATSKLAPIATVLETPSLEKTSTPTNTLIPTATNTMTLTPEPTLAQAFINSPKYGGAYIRSEPSLNASIITSMMNGELVYILPDVVEEGMNTWAHVVLPDGTEGWVIRDLLVTATPKPGW
jgi:uncharacterized membrane protein